MSGTRIGISNSTVLSPRHHLYDLQMSRQGVAWTIAIDVFVFFSCMIMLIMVKFILFCTCPHFVTEIDWKILEHCDLMIFLLDIDLMLQLLNLKQPSKWPKNGPADMSLPPGNTCKDKSHDLTRVKRC